MDLAKVKISIDYADVLELGFKRIELQDNLFFNQYGYHCFLMKFKISKTLYFEWDCLSQKVFFFRNEEIDIKNKIEILNIESLKLIISFFKEKNTDGLIVLELSDNKLF